MHALNASIVFVGLTLFLTLAKAQDKPTATTSPATNKGATATEAQRKPPSTGTATPEAEETGKKAKKE